MLLSSADSFTVHVWCQNGVIHTKGRMYVVCFAVSDVPSQCVSCLHFPDCFSSLFPSVADLLANNSHMHAHTTGVLPFLAMHILSRSSVSHTSE